MKSLSAIFLALITTTSLYARSPDSLELKRIGDQLVKLELKQGQGTYRERDNCLRDTQGNILSCYYAETSESWITDFNKDDMPDALYLFTDEGLGGGGNAYGYEYRIVLLNNKGDILEQYGIFGGGKFSFAHLEIDYVHNGEIYAVCKENPMARDPGQESEALKSMQLVFSLEDGKIIEKHFKRCPIAAMKKQIFRKDKGLAIEASLDLDDRYDEEYHERARLSGSICNAYLSGCEDVLLSFGFDKAFEPLLKTDPAAVRQELQQDLFLLKEHTIFKTLINNAYQQVSNINPALIRPDKYGNTTLHLRQADGWQVKIFVSGNEEQGSFITIRFEKPKKGDLMDFWESMASKRRLQ